MQGYNLILGLILLFFSSANTFAQQGFVGGIGAATEFNNNNYGGNARLFYGPNETFCFGPEITIFPFQKIKNEYEGSIIDLNLNAHYIFEVIHKIGVYPLSGINYTIEKERVIDSQQIDRINKIGFNYGLGAHYNLGHFFVFIEFKGVAGQLNDEFLTMGVLFGLSKKKKSYLKRH